MYINCKYSLNQNHKFYARHFFSFIPFLRLLCVDLFLLFMYCLKCIKKKIFYERKTVNKIKNRINHLANMQYLWTTYFGEPTNVIGPSYSTMSRRSRCGR